MHAAERYVVVSVGIITIVRDIDPYDLHAWLALVRDIDPYNNKIICMASSRT